MVNGPPAYPPDLTAAGLARRIGPFALMWSLASGLFTWALQQSGAPAPAAQYALPLHLISGLSFGAWGFGVFGGLGAAIARRRWRCWPDAITRYQRGGIYALLRRREIALGVLLIEPLVCVASVATLGFIFRYLWPALRPGQAPPILLNLVWGYVSAMLVITLDYLRVRATANEVRAEAAQRLAAEAQLQRLQAQLEPHMLFNTLANLHALIETDPPRAQEMLMRLNDFLRSTLRASRAPTHPLWQEFDRVADYLALMQVRMGSRLQVEIELPDELDALPIPPMLLQPLVENAIKHGLEPSRDGGLLVVSARHDGSRLILCVSDTAVGPPAEARAPERHSASLKRAPSGFGLSNVQDRLVSLYGESASLTLTPHAEGRGTLACLSLPIPCPSPP